MKTKLITMKVQLLRGRFTKDEALNILTKMVDVKIKFQEEKIKTSDNEEDIKMRESRIKELQKDLFKARFYIEHQKGKIELNSDIII
jgi:hypothetical protein